MPLPCLFLFLSSVGKHSENTFQHPPHFCYDLNYATTPGNMLDHSESNQIPGSSGPSTESGRDTGELVVDKILSELDECGLAGDRKTIDFPVKSRGKVSILYPGRLESAVWPGPHALTTRVKRCEPANTGAGRCGPGHTKQGCLSSGVAGVALTFSERRFW